MKYFILFLFLPLFSLAQSNDQLLGQWVKVKAQMKDGSRIVDHHGSGMSFLKYSFNKDGFVDESTDVLFKEVKLLYTLSDDSLLIGNMKFNIDKLTTDSLIISEKIAGLDDSKIKVFSFAKTQSTNNTDRGYYNSVIMDSVYQATPYLFPQCADRISVLIDQFSGYTTGSLKISFIVSKDGKVKDLIVLNNETISERFQKSIIKAFESSSIHWLPAKKNNAPINTKIEVILKTNHKKADWVSIEYPFLPQVFSGKEINSEQMKLEGTYFNEGIEEIKRKNYTQAIELFTRCLAIDDIDLDAYYMRAYLNHNLGNKSEACKDWSTLVGLGQVKASKILAKYCEN